MKKIVRFLLRLIGWLLLGAMVVYCWLFFPIMSGYVAKRACSEVFVAGRSPADVQAADFSFPFSIVRFRVDSTDSSVTASVLGLARKKAIFRKGLGATLVNGLTEGELRKQPMVLAGSPGFSPDTVDWPMGDRTAGTPVAETGRERLDSGIDRARLDSAVATAFYDNAHHTGRGTRAVLVVYKGQIMAERYAPGFSARTPMLGWSMAKGIINAMVGVLVRKQALDIRSPVPIPGWQADPRKAITWLQLMQMTSGLRFRWFPAGPSDLTNMLFNAKDMADFAAGMPLQAPPGTRFHYSDGNANILSRLIWDRMGDSNYYRFPYEEIFYKTGMLHTTLEPDAAGNFVGSSYCYATARDWARFGLLYLNDGMSNGLRILPEGWVKRSVSPSGIPIGKAGKGGYGALWWVDKDGYSCQGFEGQSVIVIPSKKLVIVRLALEKGYLDPANFAEDIAAAFAP